VPPDDPLVGYYDRVYVDLWYGYILCLMYSFDLLVRASIFRSVPGVSSKFSAPSWTAVGYLAFARLGCPVDAPLFEGAAVPPGSDMMNLNCRGAVIPLRGHLRSSSTTRHRARMLEFFTLNYRQGSERATSTPSRQFIDGVSEMKASLRSSQDRLHQRRGQGATTIAEVPRRDAVRKDGTRLKVKKVIAFQTHRKGRNREGRRKAQTAPSRPESGRSLCPGDQPQQGGVSRRPECIGPRGPP